MKFKPCIDLYNGSVKQIVGGTLNDNNPPKMYIEFFEDQDNLNLINCFSNESGEWKNTDLSLDKYKLSINFKEKFKFRRGRINCSMNDNEGWRWLGVQFSISEN